MSEAEPSAKKKRKREHDEYDEGPRKARKWTAVGRTKDRDIIAT